jgi:hypothetical protein
MVEERKKTRQKKNNLPRQRDIDKPDRIFD